MIGVCDVRVCYRLIAVVVKAMHTTSTHNILLESLLIDVILNVFERLGIMMDTQAIDVTFYLKGTRVHCFVNGSNDYQMNVF